MAYQIDRATKRDKARRKARHGMRISNKSIFTIVGAQVARAEKIKSGKDEQPLFIRFPKIFQPCLGRAFSLPRAWRDQFCSVPLPPLIRALPYGLIQWLNSITNSTKNPQFLGGFF